MYHFCPPSIMANTPPVIPIIPPIVKIPMPKHATMENTSTTTPKILVLLGFINIKSDTGTIMIPEINDNVIARETSSEKGITSIHIILDNMTVSKNNAINPKTMNIIPDESDNHAGNLLLNRFCFVDMSLTLRTKFFMYLQFVIFMVNFSNKHTS